MKLIVIGFLLLSVFAPSHPQDVQCLQNEATEHALQIANACGGVDDNLVDRISDVSCLQCVI